MPYMLRGTGYGVARFNPARKKVRRARKRARRRYNPATIAASAAKIRALRAAGPGAIIVRQFAVPAKPKKPRKPKGKGKGKPKGKGKGRSRGKGKGKAKGKGRRRGRRKGKRGAKGRGKYRIRRTKIRATLALVKRRGRKRGKARLVFLVPKGKRALLRRRRWLKGKVRYNPYGRNPSGIVETLKSVFTIETVKVVGGGLVGFSVAAGLSEAVTRKVFENKPDAGRGARIAVGAATGVGVSVVGSVVLSRFVSPTLGRAWLWGGLLGTVIRALAAAFPGKGLDMPRSSFEAARLADKLRENEMKSLPAPSGTKKDWLPGSQDYADVGVDGLEGVQGIDGTDGYLDIRSQHPALAASGGGQSW